MHAPKIPHKHGLWKYYQRKLNTQDGREADEKNEENNYSPQTET
jgi:hypothetical protein